MCAVLSSLRFKALRILCKPSAHVSTAQSCCADTFSMHMLSVSVGHFARWQGHTYICQTRFCDVASVKAICDSCLLSAACARWTLAPVGSSAQILAMVNHDVVLCCSLVNSSRCHGQICVQAADLCDSMLCTALRSCRPCSSDAGACAAQQPPYIGQIKALKLCTCKPGELDRAHKAGRATLDKWNLMVSHLTIQSDA